MTKPNQITVIVPVLVTRMDGLKIKLLPYNQYCYVEKKYFEREECKELGYKVLSGDSFFIVFESSVIEEAHVREGDELLTQQEIERKRPIEKQVKDYKKEIKELIGLDIKADEQADYNGRWLQRLLDKNDVKQVDNVIDETAT